MIEENDPYWLTNHLRRKINRRNNFDVLNPHTVNAVAMLPAAFHRELDTRLDELQAHLHTIKR